MRLGTKGERNVKEERKKKEKSEEKKEEKGEIRKKESEQESSRGNQSKQNAWGRKITSTPIAPL